MQKENIKNIIIEIVTRNECMCVCVWVYDVYALY